MSKEFEIMRFLAVREALNAGNHAQAYAWARRIYPIFGDDRPAKPFADDFEVSRQLATEVIKLIDDDWLGEKKLSFYDIESHFDARGYGDMDRSGLIGVLRLAYLENLFDDELWTRLTVAGSGPSESHSIAEQFDPTFDASIF